ALAEAKAALVGYALSSNRPGELPCPDYGIGAGGLDGLSDACAGNGNFVTIGRLPWKTLGLPDLRDASGESLWYAPAIELGGNGPIMINSETVPSLRVIGNNAEPIAAVIIAPGKATSTQSRPQNLTAQMTPGRYLEAFNATADTNVSVIAPNVSTEFTDQVLLITRDKLMPVVERRVLAELRTTLNSFTALPNPTLNAGGDTTCTTGVSQGFLPQTCTTPVVAWPGWFIPNGWRALIWYAYDNPKSIIVDGTGGREAVLITAGPAINGQNPAAPRGLANLLDSIENSDNDLTFETPPIPISATNNDWLLIVK
ncbi:hypothetical protein MNBD_GAMMA13-947, partial [hydrothermal vent metagenome]